MELIAQFLRYESTFQFRFSSALGVMAVAVKVKMKYIGTWEFWVCLFVVTRHSSEPSRTQFEDVPLMEFMYLVFD